MPWWLWVFVGVIALAGEAISMALFLLNVGIAAFVAALLALTEADPVWQAVVFVALSVVLIGLVRPRLLRRLTGATPPRLLSEQEMLAGRLATVTETVTDDGGEIRIGRGEFWTARPTQPLREIAVGSRVRVDHVQGLTAYVEPLPATALGSPPASTSPPTPDMPMPVPARAWPATPDIQTPLSEPPPITPATAREGESTLEAAMRAEQPHLFAELLKRHRLAAGLTQEELAERARISVRAVSSLERGVNLTPRRETVDLLAEALALSDRDRLEFAEAARGRVLRA